MLARHNGQVVLVSGTIPGERVSARVERSTRGVVYAETVEVLSASPDRREATADWKCGGNALAHIRYERQVALKAEIIQDGFRRIGRLPLAQAPEVIASPEHGYRMRARIHARDGRLGFFREASHELCDPAVTGQLLADTIAWLTALETAIQRQRLEGLTAIEVAENIPANERAVHFELQPGVDPSAFQQLADPTGSVTDVLHVRDGDPGSALTLRRGVRAFFQSNRFLLERLLRHVVPLVPAGPIVDLYAGVGLFGLSLAAAGADEVTLVEGDRASSEDLLRNAAPFGARVDVHRASVETFLRSARTPRDGTFVVDPPRTGMSKDALAGMVQKKPARIVYVSCDVATLARDARTLIDAGYDIRQITGFDLFPNTAHVETVAVLESADRSSSELSSSRG